MKLLFVIALVATIASASFYEQIQEELKELKSSHVVKELLGEMKELLDQPKKEVKLDIPHHVIEAFHVFKAKYDRTYQGEEHEYRLGIFYDNLKFIEKWYQEKTTETFDLGIGNMADLTNEEFKEMYISGGYRARPESDRNVVILPEVDFETTGGVDWRDKGIVNQVKNQESCGSCWAFSAVAAMEGAYAQKNGQLKSFSEQQLVDCSKSYGNNGCHGGLMDHAFKYAESNKMEQESAYPYTARDGNCKYNVNKGIFNVRQYTDVAHNSASQLTSAANRGVVSVAIEADKSIFQHYKSGVINSASCGTRLDHGVAVVGYDADSFIVRNSWGPTWGNRGYVQISNSNSNICGILMDPSYPGL